MTFWRDDIGPCVLNKWSRGKGFPEDERAFEKTKGEHTACFRDFKIQVYMGHEDDGAGEVGRTTSRGVWDVMLRNSAIILGATDSHGLI